MKVFSQYAVDTVLTDAEGYFTISLSENSYSVVAGLGFLKRGFLVNNPSTLFDYEVDDELVIRMVDVLKREKNYHQLTETFWENTERSLAKRIESLDSTSKSYLKERSSLFTASHRSDIFFKRALKYLAYQDKDQLPESFQEVINKATKGEIELLEVEDLEANSNNEKNVKRVLIDLYNSLELQLDAKECQCSCISTLEYGGLSSYVGRIPPYNDTKKIKFRFDGEYEKLAYYLSSYKYRRGQYISSDDLQNAWESLMKLREINHFLLQEEEVFIRSLAIKNLNGHYLNGFHKNEESDFFSKKDAVSFLSQLKVNHKEFYEAELSNLSHISMEIMDREQPFEVFYREVAETHNIPLQQQLSTLQFLNNYLDFISNEEVFRLSVAYEKTYPLRDFQGRGLYFLNSLHEKYLKKGKWEIADTLAKIYSGRRNRFYGIIDHSNIYARNHYLKAIRFWQDGNVLEAKKNFNKFGSYFIAWRSNKNRTEENWEWEDGLFDYLKFSLLYFDSDSDLERVNEIVKYTRNNEWADDFRNIEKVKDELLRIKELEIELSNELPPSEQIMVFNEMHYLWRQVTKRNAIPVFIIKKFRNQLQRAKVSLRIDPQGAKKLNVELDSDLESSEKLLEESFEIDFELHRALTSALCDDWDEAKPIFEKYHSLSTKDISYRQRVLHEVQILISKGVKHENLYKILSMFS